jgi:hypothetical protein
MRINTDGLVIAIIILILAQLITYAAGSIKSTDPTVAPQEQNESQQ